jgi:hypothetical protein
MVACVLAVSGKEYIQPCILEVQRKRISIGMRNGRVIDMSRLVQKINFGYGDMYVYGEADFEANQAMQEPLKKLYEYEELEHKKQNEIITLND